MLKPTGYTKRLPSALRKQLFVPVYAYELPGSEPLPPSGSWDFVRFLPKVQLCQIARRVYDQLVYSRPAHSISKMLGMTNNSRKFFLALLTWTRIDVLRVIMSWDTHIYRLDTWSLAIISQHYDRRVAKLIFSRVTPGSIYAPTNSYSYGSTMTTCVDKSTQDQHLELVTWIIADVKLSERSIFPSVSNP